MARAHSTGSSGKSLPLAGGPRAAGRRCGGFSLVELLVTVLVGSIVMIALLTLFTSSSRLSRSQIGIAEVQQSSRFSQHDIATRARMAARGGLPFDLALGVRNNVGADARIGDEDSPEVLESTDVLWLRGVLDTPVYQVQDDPLANALSVALGDPTTGTLIVTNPSPTGVPQDLAPLKAAVDGERPEALLIVSGLGESIWAVVELDPASSDVSAFPANVTLAFETVDEYDALSLLGAFPPALTTASHVGILEEHRYYVQEEFDLAGELQSALARQRFYPNRDVEHPDPGGVLADDLTDLQVALGFDLDGDEAVLENDPPDGNDEWIGNSAADAPVVGPLFYLRFTTLARTPFRDRGYLSPPIAAIEDRAYCETDPPPTVAEQMDRMFRRRTLTSTVDLRNLF